MLAYLGAFAALTTVAWDHGAERSDERGSAAVVAAPGTPVVRIPPAAIERARSAAPRTSTDVSSVAAPRQGTRPVGTASATRPRAADRAVARVEPHATARPGGSAPSREPPRTAPSPPAPAPAPTPVPAPTVPVSATSASATTLRSVTSAPAPAGDADVLELHFAVRRPDVPGLTEVTVPVTVQRAAAPDALRIDVRLDLDAAGGPSARVRVADADPASRSVTVDGSGAAGGEQAVVVPLPLQDGAPVLAPPAPFRTPPTTLELPVLGGPSVARPERAAPRGR